MKRPGVFLAVTLLAIGSAARAGELDSEFGTKEKANPSTPSAVAPAGTGSELDEESPAQACGFGRRRGFFGFGGFGYGFPGYGFGYGYPGFGFGGFGYSRFGFGGFGFNRGFGGFGFNRGFGGFGRGFGGFGFRRGRW